MNFSWTMQYSALHYPFELFFSYLCLCSICTCNPVCEMNVYLCVVACGGQRLTPVFSSIFFCLTLLYRISQLILELFISQLHPQIPCLCLLSNGIIGRPPVHLHICMSFQTLVSGCLITLASGPSVHPHLLFIHVIKYLCFSFFSLISESFSFFMRLTLQKVTIRKVQARLLLYALLFSLSLFI